VALSQYSSTTRADATKNKQEFDMQQIPLSLMKQSKNLSSLSSCWNSNVSLKKIK
jgi:hypothetical protein